MKQNTNMLGTGYQITGTDKFSAAQAFHSIERATKTVSIDLSAISFLSLINDEDHRLTAMYLTGDEEWCFSNQGAYIPAKLFEIEEAAQENLNKYPILVTESLEEGKVDIQEEGIFLIASSMFKLLSRMLKIEGSDFGFLRDYSLAQKCAEMDITPITLVYREVNGVKKAFTFYRRKNENSYLKFDDLLDSVRKVKYLLDLPTMEVCRWEITQEKRSVSFQTASGSLTVSWSDIGRAPFTVEYMGKTIKTSLEILGSDIAGILTGQFTNEKDSKEKEVVAA